MYNQTMSSSWYMYVVRCRDDSLYTGIATDPARRIHEHNHTARGAKYTRRRRPVTLLATWSFESRSEASKAEYAFKRLSRPEKLARIARDADA